MKALNVLFGIILLGHFSHANEENSASDCVASCNGHILELKFEKSIFGKYVEPIYESSGFTINDKAIGHSEEYSLRLCSIADDVRPMHRGCRGIKNGVDFHFVTPYQQTSGIYQVTLEKGRFPSCPDKDIVFSCEKKVPRDPQTLIRQFSNAVCSQNTSAMYKILKMNDLKILDELSDPSKSWTECAMSSYQDNPLVLDLILQQAKMKEPDFIPNAAWNKILSKILFNESAYPEIGPQLIAFAKQQGFSEKDFDFDFERFMQRPAYLDNVLKEFPTIDLNTPKPDRFNLLTSVMLRLFQYSEGKEATEQLALKLIRDPKISLKAAMPIRHQHSGAPLVFFATGSAPVLEALRQRESLAKYTDMEDSEGKTIADYMDIYNAHGDWNLLIKYFPKAKLKAHRFHYGVSSIPLCVKEATTTFLPWLNCQGIYPEQQIKDACAAGNIDLLKRAVPLDADPRPIIEWVWHGLKGEEISPALWHYILNNKSDVGSERILGQLIRHVRDTSPELEGSVFGVKWDLMARALNDVLTARKDIGLHFPLFKNYDHLRTKNSASDAYERKDKETGSYGGGIFYLLYYAIKHGHPELIDIAKAHRPHMNQSSKTTWNNQVGWTEGRGAIEFVPSIADLLKDPKLESRWWSL